MPTEVYSPCSINGCTNRAHARTWCQTHYSRWRLYGDPEAPRLIPDHRTHGHTAGGGKWRSPTYISWQAMRDRCRQPSNRHWARYGGRGITVCERWLTFANFLEDMGERPEGMTLDRVDVDGNYTPDNCRWATDTEQRRGRLKH